MEHNLSLNLLPLLLAAGLFVGSVILMVQRALNIRRLLFFALVILPAGFVTFILSVTLCGFLMLFEALAALCSSALDRLTFLMNSIRDAAASSQK